jgi:hypothetical protein
MRTVTVIFDEAYIEPALVTAHQTLNSGALFDRLVLIYSRTAVCPTGGQSINDASKSVEPSTLSTRNHAQLIDNIKKFVGHYNNSKISVSAIQISEIPWLDSFQYAHFSAAIIKKLFIPTIIGSRSDKEIIVNLDAGFIFGKTGKDVLQAIFDKLSLSSAVVGAFSHKFDGTFFDFDEVTTRFSLDISRMQQRLYPAGTVLAFNCCKWLQFGFHELVCLTLRDELSRLRMAEQEILLLACKPGEILDLHQIFREDGVEDYFVTPFLNNRPTDLSSVRQIVSKYADGNYGLFKVVGSCKPWHQDFYDPVKLPYLDAVHAMYSAISNLDSEAFSPFRSFQYKHDNYKCSPQMTRYQMESGLYRMLSNAFAQLTK